MNHLKKGKNCIKKDNKEFMKNNKLISTTQKRFKCEKHNVALKNST